MKKHTKLLTLDRIEGEYAIMEMRNDGMGAMLTIEKSLLPKDAAEGDIFEYDGETLSPLLCATHAVSSRIQNKFERLKNGMHL